MTGCADETGRVPAGKSCKRGNGAGSWKTSRLIKSSEPSAPARQYGRDRSVSEGEVAGPAAETVETGVSEGRGVTLDSSKTDW